LELLKEGKNLVRDLWDVFRNYYKNGSAPVRKREDNEFLYFKCETNENKEKAAAEEIEQEHKKTNKNNHPI
jgi:hypothetical protein